MFDTNLYGTITELKCITYFLELGYQVSVPQSPARYDFILDTGNQLLKIQVKSANDTAVEGAITFQTCSQHITGTGNNRQNYQGQIDYFCTYYNNECYLIPISECGNRTKSLRLVPPKNGQVKNICFAKDYIAKEILSK
jgi:hypothetical protein